MSASAEDYCQALVREQDKDRYLTSLLAPEALRPHIHALDAFNIELARIRETVSGPALGEIRLQWWQEAIDGIYCGVAPATPVTQALARAVERADLPKQALSNMIEARTFDLYDDPMPDLATLEGYLGETSSALIQLTALVLAGSDALGAATASGYAGVAYGIAGLLRSLPVHRSRGQCFIPADLLARHGSSPAHVLSGRLDQATEFALTDLRRHAAERLAEARGRRVEIPGKALPAFLHAGLADLYLAKLGQRGFNPLREIAEVSQLRKQLRLLRCAIWERF